MVHNVQNKKAPKGIITYNVHIDQNTKRDPFAHE